jgi:hypothetical protein
MLNGKARWVQSSSRQTTESEANRNYIIIPQIDVFHTSFDFHSIDLSHFLYIVDPFILRNITIRPSMSLHLHRCI